MLLLKIVYNWFCKPILVLINPLTITGICKWKHSTENVSRPPVKFNSTNTNIFPDKFLRGYVRFIEQSNNNATQNKHTR